MRILIIDDDTAVLESLRMTLAYEDYDVVCAPTGRLGLALVERVAPDLVLLDIDMPDLNGLDVLATLRVRHESLPIVIMSGHTLARADAMYAGATAFLEKPFESSHDILTTLNSALTAPGRPHERSAARAAVSVPSG